jgi:ribonucleoside-diphosphate reductase alpha chain
MGGRYVPSLLAAIGEVIERHMIDTGFLADPGRMDAERGRNRQALGRVQAASGGDGPARAGAPFRQCPKCGQASLVHEEGCDNCRSCTYSKCA